MRETASITSESYDAIVVGARCAGAATAMLLAREGLSVLLVDGARHGTDTLSTLALMRAGVLQLHRWGLLEKVRAAGTPAITSTSFIYGDETVTVPIKPRDGVDALYAPRRWLIDTLLADAAADAGAEVVYSSRLVDLERASDGRVVGATIKQRDAAVRRVRASIVIGADGRRSTVARLVQAATCRESRQACGVVYTFWPGLENNRSRWFYRPGVSAGSIPTNNGDACLFVATPQARFHDEIRTDRKAHYRQVLTECAPELAGEVAQKAPSEPLRSFPGQPGLIRQSYGPGWALVGDAGYFKDPITAHGITDALRDAELLARAVIRGSDQALAEYQSTRDELSWKLFDITDTIAGFQWDLDSLKPLHLELSKTMNGEVEALLGLDAYTRRTT
uniref:2-polyprenyl-6-methoxyphenol hydroxylase n=1 Tax=uncultured bacterium F42-01 TaxID=1191438 RepID=I3VIK4_9BACT|nr:2-polyprenyl-6-methoxyphenol hydroxylase [uncultured bacterium F42-01]